MSTLDRRAGPTELTVVSILFALACVLALGAAMTLVVLTLSSPPPAHAQQAASTTCRICGVVEDVREVTLDALKNGVSTVHGEGFAMFFGLVSGKLRSTPVKVYEVAVRLGDGSTRVLQEASLPVWKPGDRVKVMMGQVRPLT
ncbi:MAG: hypothetical protein H7Y16_02600 [Candidatus Parcubacteria bacterium]|nr:hypothetical protein [Burkholderiales bacterium]